MAERDTKANYLLHLLRIHREHLYLVVHEGIELPWGLHDIHSSQIAQK